MFKLSKLPPSNSLTSSTTDSGATEYTPLNSFKINIPEQDLKTIDALTKKQQQISNFLFANSEQYSNSVVEGLINEYMVREKESIQVKLRLKS